jgi:lysophospholipase L1-like esterase
MSTTFAAADCAEGARSAELRRVRLAGTAVCLLALAVISASGAASGVAVARAAEAAKPKLFLIGGSTMASFPPTRPVVGWGQMLPKYFRDPTMVDNRALSGRSSKSFIDQGHWAKVLGDLRAGDFLIVCFGTNDSKESDPARYAAPRGAFQANLERFLRETREKGATPILATSVARRQWDERGNFVEPPSEWVSVTREVAARERAPLMELRDATVALEKSLGPEGSKTLHLYLPAGKYDSYPNGAKDDTHYCAHGADRVAQLAVQELRRLGLPLTAWLRAADAPAAGGAGPRSKLGAYYYGGWAPRICRSSAASYSAINSGTRRGAADRKPLQIRKFA